MGCYILDVLGTFWIGYASCLSGNLPVNVGMNEEPRKNVVRDEHVDNVFVFVCADDRGSLTPDGPSVYALIPFL